MKRRFHLLLASSLALAVSACNYQAGNSIEAQKPGTRPRHFERAGWIRRSSRATISSNYANGNWVKNTEIPADRSSIGGFWIADQEREKNTRELFDKILKSKPTSGTTG